MKRIQIVHPFLFSVFPALSLYAYNIKSIPISLGELIGPIFGSLAVATILITAFARILSDREKAAILLFLMLAWFFSFGRIMEIAAEWTGGIFNRSLFFASLILIGIISYFIIRSQRTFHGLTKFLNLVAVTLVVINLASVAQTLAHRSHVDIERHAIVSGPTPSRPNIYYIILDAYTRADILDELFEHDNSGFLIALENMGFHIASQSYANYSQTHHSLASSLNFTYLDSLAEKMGPVSADREPLYGMIQKNDVSSFLKSQGYKLISISSSIWPTDLKNVDRYIGFKKSASEFRDVFLATTPLPLFLNLTLGVSEYDAHRSRILQAFEALPTMPFEKGPFFLFAHIMCPHPPFVFGPAGDPVQPNYRFSLFDADRIPSTGESRIRDYLVRYRDQLTFLNRKILSMVESILSRSVIPPVIILQGDHGSRAYADLDRWDASNIKENLAIFNAVLMPGLDPGLFYPTLSPVNTFRLIFREYFKVDLELLEDKSFWCTWYRPYKFILFDESMYTTSVKSKKP